MDRKARIQQINSRYHIGAGRSNIIVSESALGRQPLGVTRTTGAVRVPSTTVLAPPPFAQTLTSTSVATPMVATFAPRPAPLTTTVVPSYTTVTPVLTAPTFSTVSSVPHTTTVVGSPQPIRQTVETFQTVENSPGKSTAEFHPSQPNPDYWEPDVVGSDSRKRAIDTPLLRRQGCCERCTMMCPRCCGCPWWLCLLLSLLVLGLLIGGIQFLMNAAGKKSNSVANIDRGSSGSSNLSENDDNSNTGSGSESNSGSNSENSQGSNSNSGSTFDNNSSSSTVEDSNETLSCSSGYFLHNGKCLSCPGGSNWNGSHCIKKEIVNKIFVAKIVKNSSGTFVVRNQTADGEKGKVSPGYENGEQSQGGQAESSGNQGPQSESAQGGASAQSNNSGSQGRSNQAEQAETNGAESRQNSSSSGTIANIDTGKESSHKYLKASQHLSF